jgi:hypothetical protein
MKTLLTILLFLSLNAHATDYYVSNTGSDAAAGTSTGTAWQTISKVNTIFSTLQPGDRILFKRGDTFTGTLIPTASGSSGNPITIGAYGTGDEPIITGAATVTAWTSLGSNLYVTTNAITASTSLKLHMVTINGVPFAQGRYPNPDAANRGYLTIDSHVGATSFTDAALPSSTFDWDNAQFVYRPQRWYNDTVTGTHSGTTVTFTRTGAEPRNGYGYFIQNHPNTLDQHGEWYYNPVSRKCTLYLTTAPANYTIRFATTDQLLTITGRSYLTFENIKFEGANNINATIGSTSSNITFNNCDFVNIGGKALVVNGNSNTITVSGCLFYHNLNTAIDFSNAGNAQVVTGNTFKQISMFPGMLGGGDFPGSGYGIYNNSGANHTYSNNIFDSLGRVAIRFGGANNVTIEKNFINHFAEHFGDAGGIHWTNHTTLTERTGRVVRYNIVLNGGNNGAGISTNTDYSVGIYSDDNSSGVEVAYNTAYNTTKGGYLHNSRKQNWHHNTWVDSYEAAMHLRKDNSANHNIEEITYKHNKSIVYKFNLSSGSPWTISLDHANADNSGAEGNINSFGTIDSNVYARPMKDDATIQLKEFTVYFGGKTLAEYQALYNHDDHSTKAPITYTGASLTPYVLFAYNPTDNDSTLTISEQYMDADGVIYNPPSATIPAWGSLVLFETGVTPPPSNENPTANAGNDIPVTLPYPLELSETLNPGDDVYTRLSTGTTNYSAADTLIVKTSPGGSVTRRTYLKFSLANTYETITSATLRLYGRNVEDNISQIIQVFGVASDGWSEGTLTWNTQPAYTSGTLGTMSINATAAYRTVDVTNYIQSEVSGDKVASLAVLDTTTTQAKLVSFFSKEKSSNKPELVINSTRLISLNGAASSDQDGVISSYAWVKLSGPTGGDITSPTSATTTVTNLTTGTYAYKLTVTDNEGATDTDTVNVIVGGASNEEPVANAGTDQTIALPTSQVTVDASGSSDPDGTIASYEWSKVTGGDATITSATSASTTITGLTQGVYVFKVRVTDDDGAFAEDQIIVTVNAAPTIQRRPYKSAAGKFQKTTNILGQ